MYRTPNWYATHGPNLSLNFRLVLEVCSFKAHFQPRYNLCLYILPLVLDICDDIIKRAKKQQFEVYAYYVLDPNSKVLN
jgi:hypothetical protein